MRLTPVQDFTNEHMRQWASRHLTAGCHVVSDGTRAFAQVRQAQANLIQVQNNLTNLLDGPSQEDLDIARAQVQQSQLSVLQAENALANAQLVAPFAGIVSVVNIAAGELAGGGPAIALADLGQFHLNVLVDETDVRAIQVGQAVSLRVDALPDTRFRGSVVGIVPTVDRAKATVMTKIRFEKLDARILPEMSAKVSFLSKPASEIIVNFPARMDTVSYTHLTLPTIYSV